MAVKAKERVVNNSLTGKLAIALVVIIIAMMTGTYVYNSTHPETARIFGSIMSVVMIFLLVMVLRYADTTYDILLTHDRLEVEHRVTRWYHRIVAEIPVSAIMQICPAADFGEEDAKVITGKQVRYTVSPRETSKFQFYTILYRRNGKVNAMMLQCSKSFARAIAKGIQ